jgi:DNA-binding transcriptional LysR family regulator
MALDALHASDAGIRVTVLSGLNEALMPMVRRGEIDCALSSVPRTAIDPELQHEALHTDTAVVVAHVDHPLAARRSVRNASKSEEPGPASCAASCAPTSTMPRPGAARRCTTAASAACTPRVTSPSSRRR